MNVSEFCVMVKSVDEDGYNKATIRCHFPAKFVYYQHRYDPSPKRYDPLYDQDSGISDPA